MDIKKEFRSFLESGNYNMGKFLEESELKEMAIAGKGDWKPNVDMIEYKSSNVVKLKWKLIDTFTPKNGIEMELRTLKDEYIVGRFIEEINEFEIFLHMKMSEDKETASDFKINKRLMNVDGVKVKETAQGSGIALMTYKSIIKKQNIIILGDEVQYFGARRLWTKLSKEVDVRVDIIDLHSETILEKDVILKHGTDDWDFDKRVWSYDFDKKYIRLLLKEIK